LNNTSQYQDAITYSQPLMMEITDESVLELFEDRNFVLVLGLLRTRDGAMTVKELVDAFVKAGEKRSDKTIYRYSAF